MKAELTDAERKDLSNRPSGAPSWQELNKQHNEACGMLNEQRKEIDALRAELAGCYECCKLSDAQIEKLKAELATAQATIAEAKREADYLDKVLGDAAESICATLGLKSRRDDFNAALASLISRVKAQQATIAERDTETARLRERVVHPILPAKIYCQDCGVEMDDDACDICGGKP